MEKIYIESTDSQKFKQVLEDFKTRKKEQIILQIKNEPFHLLVKQFFRENSYLVDVSPIDNESKKSFGETGGMIS